MQSGAIGTQIGSLGATQPGMGGMQMSPAATSRGTGNSSLGLASSRGVESPAPRAPGGGRSFPPPSSSTRAGTSSTHHQQTGLGSTAPVRQEQQKQTGGKGGMRPPQQKGRDHRLSSEIDQLLEGMSDDDDTDYVNVSVLH